MQTYEAAEKEYHEQRIDYVSNLIDAIGEVRLDSSEEAINELDQLSRDDCHEEARDEAVDEIGGEWPEDEDDEMPEWDFTTREEWEAALEDAQNRIGDEAFMDAVNEALSVLEY